MLTLRAVFLDRDGVLNQKAPPHEYITAPEDLLLLPDADKAVARLNAAGLLVLLATNQRGISRGMMSKSDLDAVHAHLTRLLARENAHLDGIYYCPHGLDDRCGCRKPAPGLLLAAMADYGLDARECLMIGDSLSDMLAAQAAGMPGVLVGEGTEPLPDDAPIAWRARDLAQAVERLVGWGGPLS